MLKPKFQITKLLAAIFRKEFHTYDRIGDIPLVFDKNLDWKAHIVNLAGNMSEVRKNFTSVERMFKSDI